MFIPVQQKRNSVQKEQIREAILTAAQALILQGGWQTVSMRKISEAIGYSLPIVYRHFESKDALMEDFVKKGFEQLNIHLLLAIVPSETTAQQLQALAAAYTGFAQEESAYYQLMFGLGMPSCDRMNQLPELSAFRQTLVNAIEPLLHAQEQELLALKFHSFWSILHGLSSIRFIYHEQGETLQKQVLTDVVNGFILNINN